MSSYVPQELVTVVVTGEAFTFDRYPEPPVSKGKRRRKEAYYNDEREMPETTPEGRKYLAEQLRRRKSRFAAALSAIKDHDRRYFVSLITPREQRPFVSMAEEHKVLARFVRRLCYRFPNCRFIYKIEWDSAVRIHYHLIGDFTSPGELPRTTPPQLKREVKRMWEAATRASADNSVDVKWYAERHKSYLTGRDKFKEDLHCLDLLQGGRMWGYINKKNFAFYKKEIFKLTPRQFERYSSYITSHINKRSTSRSHIIQLSRSRGRVSYDLTNDVIKDAIKHAKSRG